MALFGDDDNDLRSQFVELKARMEGQVTRLESNDSEIVSEVKKLIKSLGDHDETSEDVLKTLAEIATEQGRQALVLAGVVETVEMLKTLEGAAKIDASTTVQTGGGGVENVGGTINQEKT